MVQSTPGVGDETKLSFSYSLYSLSGSFNSEVCLSSRCGTKFVGLFLLHSFAVKESD